MESSAGYLTWLQLPPRQPLIRFHIFRGSFLHDIGGQHRAGRSFIPRQRFEIIADELLVEAGLAFAGRVLVGGPEARGIGRQHFINQDQLPLEHAELEFRIRDDDAALPGIIAARLVDHQAQVARLRGEIRADDLARLVERNVFVVAGFGFGRWREDGFGQFGGFGQAGGQLDAADGLRLPVFLEAGAAEVAAHDALDGERLRFLHEHGAALNVGELRGRKTGQSRDFKRIVRTGEQMVRHERGKLLEPEMGNLREHLALARDAVGHDDVEGGDAVAGDEEVGVAEIENLADLAALDLRDAGQIELEKWLCAHGGAEDGGAKGGCKLQVAGFKFQVLRFAAESRNKSGGAGIRQHPPHLAPALRVIFSGCALFGWPCDDAGIVSNNIESAPPRPPHRWPWFVLAAVIAAVVLAVLWMVAEVRRVKTFEHLDFRPQPTNTAP